MPLTTYAANKQLDHLFGKTAFTMPTVYVGLSSTTPTLAGGNITPPVATGYARFTTSGTSWAAAGATVNGQNTNAIDLPFGPATADWVGGNPITYVTFHDALSGGNCLGYVALTVPRTVLSGQTFKILAGAFTETIS